MRRQDATEAAAIIDRMLANLIATVPPKGRAGSLALTAIVAGPGTGDPGSEVLITWRTWHTYPQTGEVVVTSSSLWRQGVAHNRTQA